MCLKYEPWIVRSKNYDTNTENFVCKTCYNYCSLSQTKRAMSHRYIKEYCCWWWFLMDHFTKLMKEGYLVTFHEIKRPKLTITGYILDEVVHVWLVSSWFMRGQTLHKRVHALIDARILVWAETFDRGVFRCPRNIVVELMVIREKF